ncbi:hypothetical protein CWI80_03890 [Pseudidiomarina sediminum]|uniref:Uncharacterized protein n=1 Tax=Pseudidiomarina sediminum TaxID=431675 RepID=A0A432Z9F7_9GAMM|nr:hypothetical protein [Pseudidiomarina sediminum]RUO74491.1 hypothetical protein CWI80_03890 [Pseudidiomarina sediminum]
MKPEQSAALAHVEPTLKRQLQRFSTQLEALGQRWNMLSEHYQGRGAEEMDEMHRQIMARLEAYEENYQALLKQWLNEVERSDVS